MNKVKKMMDFLGLKEYTYEIYINHYTDEVFLRTIDGEMWFDSFGNKKENCYLDEIIGDLVLKCEEKILMDIFVERVGFNPND